VTELANQIRTEIGKGRRRTGVDAALEQLSPSEQRELVAAILDPCVPLQAITSVMLARGIRLSTHSIRKARRGEIPCGVE